MNDARKETERIIDRRWKAQKGELKKKPRTNRKVARKEYLKVARKKRVSAKERRGGIKKQLGYIHKNLRIIKQLAEEKLETSLRKREQEKLVVIEKIYDQQKEMWEEEKNRVEERIVSLNQPHVRPIVRGKAGKPTEFGAKVSLSYVDGYVFLDRLSWENYNESGDLKSQVEKYQEKYGYYPESVHVDQIYRTRENLKWCKERGIRVSGPPLGRPKKNVSLQDKKQALEDERYRNRIEGKLGQAKRRFGLNRVMTKLQSTSETSIGITILVVNLFQLLKQLLGSFLPFFLINRTSQLKKGIWINLAYKIGLLNQKYLSIT